MIIQTYIKENPPAAGAGIRLAICQGKGPAGNEAAIQHNLQTLKRAVQSAKTLSAHLVSFPELFISGYTLTPESGHVIAMEPDGPTMSEIATVALENRIGILCPYPEKAVVVGATRYYDSMALFGENGSLLKNYRKTHLWGPDERKVWDAGYVFPEEGEPYTVHYINGFPLGLLNCYEAEFAELTRILALRGAKLVVIPTAADKTTLLSTGEWTPTPYPDVSHNLIPAHALESGIFVAYSNRCQEETLDGNRVGEFLGNSVIADPHGQLMLAARNQPTLLIGDCIPADYGPTHPLDTDYLKDRRPGLYRELVHDPAGSDDG